MFETYRMLGREHQADLEREARRAALARAVGQRPAPVTYRKERKGMRLTCSYDTRSGRPPWPRLQR
jgi:hypothetical protein